jgi:hypothetical protein
VRVSRHTLIVSLKPLASHDRDGAGVEVLCYERADKSNMDLDRGEYMRHV